MDVILGLVGLVLVASFIALAIDVRGLRTDQREHLNAILAELRAAREDREGR